MRRRKSRKRKTDYGTIVLHWLLVGSLLVAIFTGLRIATEAPDRTWINALDGVLPKSMVWTGHMPAAVVLVAVALGYPVYMSLAGLGRRIRLDRVRIAGLFGRSQPRWGAVNVILYWVFYAALLAELVTGGLLYFSYANNVLLNVHWYGMWVIVGYAGLHVMAHFVLGGAPQLLRIFRPAPLSPPPRPFDPAEVFALLDQQSTRAAQASGRGRPQPARRPEAAERELSANRPQPPRPPETPRREALPPRPMAPRYGEPVGRDRPPTPRHAEAPARRRPDVAADPGRPRRRGPVLQANPFVVATAVALVGAGFVVAVDREMVDTLYIRHIDKAEVPAIDGDASDPIWRTVRPFYVLTEQGGNFDGKGETTVEIRAVHDGEWAYFLFVWDDPTRSLKQLPLQKAADGWHLLHNGYEVGDEHDYSEDKFSVLLTKMNVVLAGDRTFHAGPTPVADKPSTLSGRGLHFTMQEGVYAEVWQWKASSGGPAGRMDDDLFGPPAEPTQAQVDGKVPYRGGFSQDPGVNYSDNFEPLAGPNAYAQPVKPKRLPKDYRAMTAVMGKIDLDPNHGESDGARWYMTDTESVAYSEQADSQIPVGTVIPGVIIAGEYSGDRAEIRCAARWAGGRWVLEVARRLEVKNKFDVPISTGTFMRVAAFDHSQIRHTRHVRPIRLEVE